MATAELPQRSLRRLALLYLLAIALVTTAGVTAPEVGVILIFFLPSCAFGMFVLWTILLIAQFMSRQTPRESDNVAFLVAHMIGTAAIGFAPAIAYFLIC